MIYLFTEPCQLCGNDQRRSTERSLWYDPTTKQYVVIPRCLERLACARRVAIDDVRRVPA